MLLRLLLLFIISLNHTFAEMREWQSVSGSTVKAEMTQWLWDTVTLKTESKREITLKISQLSKEDQQFLKAYGPIIVVSAFGSAAESKFGDSSDHFDHDELPEINWIHEKGEGPHGHPSEDPLKHLAALEEAMIAGKKQSLRRFFVFNLMRFSPRLA